MGAKEPPQQCPDPDPCPSRPVPTAAVRSQTWGSSDLSWLWGAHPVMGWGVADLLSFASCVYDSLPDCQCPGYPGLRAPSGVGSARSGMPWGPTLVRWGNWCGRRQVGSCPRAGWAASALHRAPASRGAAATGACAPGVDTAPSMAPAGQLLGRYSHPPRGAQRGCH